jgi:tRNA-splicing ligase RtcB (3'-phosphate/5'-hydroxy nucleic acid ligase)
MKILQGQYNTAKVFTDNIESEACDQIKTLLDQEVFSRSKVRIMPDVHAGKGCVVGFTMTLDGDIPLVPNLIGVDISCGMLSVNLGPYDIDYKGLDTFIRSNIPYGHEVNDMKYTRAKMYESLAEKITTVAKIIDPGNIDRHLCSVGSLGSGNHFLEVDVDTKGNKWLIIHTGSRNFGMKVAMYHQKIAESKCLYGPRELAYLTGTDRDLYLEHMKVAQEFATTSRRWMADRILKYLSEEQDSNFLPTAMTVGCPCGCVSFETIHNYISFEDNILRKGAISAKAGEKVLIPLNMADGCIVGIGKGNADWNTSAPHGAGRIYSRTKAKKELTLDAFKASMTNVWTSCVNAGTLDESPMAYKNAQEIIAAVGDTVDIVEVMKPVYNFKATE